MAEQPDQDNKNRNQEAVGLKQIRRLYARTFPGINLHHPIPVSRIPGPSDGVEACQNRQIVFPYNIDAHDAYHVLTWNLRIDQVWENLEHIYYSIFETKEDQVRRPWFSGVDLESGDYILRAEFYRRKRSRLKELVETKHLRNVWFRAFGSEDISTAENLLKIMMLFMIFGQKMADQKKLFDNGTLAEFVENNSKLEGYRFWASHTLFGDGGSIRGIKSQIADILNKNRFYSL